jgi:hypothetical protein
VPILFKARMAFLLILPVFANNPLEIKPRRMTLNPLRNVLRKATFVTGLNR